MLDFPFKIIIVDFADKFLLLTHSQFGFVSLPKIIF